MGVITIKASTKAIIMLRALAEKLGGHVLPLTDDQYEDLLLGNLLKKEKTGKKVSCTTIFRKLKGR